MYVCGAAIVHGVLETDMLDTMEEGIHTITKMLFFSSHFVFKVGKEYVFVQYFCNGADISI